jgi:hypothetical protein
LALALAAAVPSPARAEPAVALLPGNALTTFDTTTPQTTTTVAISGLGTSETVSGIDVRPADGLLYGVTATTGSAANSVLKTYRIDPVTGVATLIGATAALAGAGDVATGVDFNPVVDRIRYVNTNDENARLNPTTGALAANDADLTPTSDIIATAYDRNVAGATLSTLFAINRNTSRLALIGGVDGTPSPNGGVVTDFAGGLGFTLSPGSDGGFDVSAGGTAVAALTPASDGVTRLYTIDLATGAATVLGRLGAGSAVRGLAILPTPPSAPPPAAPAPDKTAPNVLVSVSARAKLSAGAIRRIKITFTCNEGCAVTARLRVGKKTIATGNAALTSPDVGSLRLRTSARQRREISRLHRKRVPRLRATLALTFTDAAGNTRRIARRMTLRR